MAKSSVDKAIDELNKKYPEINAVDVDEWDQRGEGRGIWFRGSENGVEASDGNRLISYYGWESDPEGKIWDMGVHKELVAVLEKHGLYGEFNDPGTLMAFKC